MTKQETVIMNNKDYDVRTSYKWDNSLDYIFTLKKKEPLKGRYVVFTGTLSKMERDEAMRLATRFGATVQSRITSKTTDLIVGLNPGNVKLQEGIAQGAKIINDKTWNDLVAKNK